MRILFLSNLFPPNQIGGYEVLCARVAALFAERGHDVHVLTSSYGGKIARAPDMKVSQGLRLLCGETIYHPFVKGEVRQRVITGDNEIVTRKVIQRIRPDFIFSWNLYGLSKDYFRFLEASGVPTVCMLTDNWLAAMMAPDFTRDYFEYKIYNDNKSTDAAAARVTQHLNCSAIFGARYMQSFYEAAGLAFEDATVIHNGVDLSAQLSRVRLPRRDFVNGNAGPVKLLFAGRLVKLKGVHTAIEALGWFSQGHSQKMALTIVGDGADTAYMASLRHLAVRLGVAEQITLVPPLPEAALPDLFDAHDIFLFPSLYEPFSLTLIHALASGIPTVASSTGGNVEIVNDGRTGFLFSAGEAKELAAAVQRLSEDAGLREQVSVAGREAASQFTITRMIEQIEGYLIRRGLVK
jgi:glycosyltransferase involved in cell wall biosynthesis